MKPGHQCVWLCPERHLCVGQELPLVYVIRRHKPLSIIRRDKNLGLVDKKGEATPLGLWILCTTISSENGKGGLWEYTYTHTWILLQPKLVALYMLFSYPKSWHCCDDWILLWVFFFAGGSYGLNVKVRGIWKIVHSSTELLTAVYVVLFQDWRS